MSYLEFSVYCATCGTGLCNETNVRGNIVNVNVCPDCIENKDIEIENLKDEIKSLENENEKLNEIIESLQIENKT